MNKVYSSIAIAMGVILLGSGLVFAAQGQESTQEKIDRIFSRLKEVTDRELATGQTETDEFGTYFVGDSARIIEAAHARAQAEADALIARPASERALAIAAIRTFAHDDKLEVTYQRTMKSTYDNTQMSEMYYVDKDQYEVLISNNKIVQFGPRPLSDNEALKEYRNSPAKTQAELERMAKDFIANQGYADLSTLTPRQGSKIEVFFFRWEDTRTTMQGDMHPFIQVGLSTGGELVSYADTLDVK